MTRVAKVLVRALTFSLVTDLHDPPSVIFSLSPSSVGR
jgi:hypothetical protein